MLQFSRTLIFLLDTSEIHECSTPVVLYVSWTHVTFVLLHYNGLMWLNLEFKVGQFCPCSCWIRILMPLSITSLNRVASPTVGWNILSDHPKSIDTNINKRGTAIVPIWWNNLINPEHMWLKIYSGSLTGCIFLFQHLGVAQQAVHTIESAVAKRLLIHTLSIYRSMLVFRSFHLMNNSSLFF